MNSASGVGNFQGVTVATYFRKIDIKMWTDARFRRLSPLPPSGQGLWIYLIAGRETTNLPGLIVAGEAALAESLGWNLKAFREAFREVFREGLAEADFEARLIWVPNAVKYHPPQSPNVVKSWSTKWELVPECDLKTKAYRGLKAFVEGLGKGFAEAFAKGIENPLLNQGAGSREQGAGNREQETTTTTFKSETVTEPTIKPVRLGTVDVDDLNSHPIWKPGSPITSTADLEAFAADQGWAVTGLSSKDRGRAHAMIRAGPISPEEATEGIDRMGTVAPARPVGYWLSCVEAARKDYEAAATTDAPKPKPKYDAATLAWMKENLNG